MISQIYFSATSSVWKSTRRFSQSLWCYQNRTPLCTRNHRFRGCWWTIKQRSYWNYIWSFIKSWYWNSFAWRTFYWYHWKYVESQFDGKNWIWFVGWIDWCSKCGICWRLFTFGSFHTTNTSGWFYISKLYIFFRFRNTVWNHFLLKYFTLENNTDAYYVFSRTLIMNYCQLCFSFTEAHLWPEPNFWWVRKDLET